MRSTLEERALGSLPSWQKANPRLKKLVLMDKYLDGDIYSHLRYEYHQDAMGDDQMINFYKRKPVVKFNLARLAATSIARKLFAGRHAPSLVLDGQDAALKKIKELLKQSDLDSQMINLVTRGSVGSVCAVFRIVETDDGPQLVIDVEKAVDCYPSFDAAKQLSKLRVIKQLSGTWFLDHGVLNDSKGEKIDAKKTYWYIKEMDKVREIHYQPMRLSVWNPYSGKDKEELKIIEEGDLAPVNHNLNMVPAHWFMNLSCGVFPDGGCLFEPALDNVVAYDYKMSQLWLGLMNAACPITVLKGKLLSFQDEDGNDIPRSPSRVIQFEGTVKDGDVTEQGGDAKFLETNGMGFAAAQEFCRAIKKDASEQICSSRKDPDKVTTAMSGKGMGVVEEEFRDLVMELRTSYGQNGYLKLVKKIVKAAIRANHPLIKGVTELIVDLLDLAWPDLDEMSPQEQQLFTAGLEQAQEAGVLAQEDAHDVYKGKMDIHDGSSKLPKKKEKPKSSNTQGKN